MPLIEVHVISRQRRLGIGGKPLTTDDVKAFAAGRKVA